MANKERQLMSVQRHNDCDDTTHDGAVVLLCAVACFHKTLTTTLSQFVLTITCVGRRYAYTKRLKSDQHIHNH